MTIQALKTLLFTSCQHVKTGMHFPASKSIISLYYMSRDIFTAFYLPISQRSYGGAFKILGARYQRSQARRADARAPKATHGMLCARDILAERCADVEALMPLPYGRNANPNPVPQMTMPNPLHRSHATPPFAVNGVSGCCQG